MENIINPVQVEDVRKGNFPIFHDIILKVEYIHDCGLCWQYFSTCSPFVETVRSILSKLAVVRFIKVIKVEDFK